MQTLKEFEDMQAESHKYYTIYDAGELISNIGVEEFMQNVLYSVENPEQAVLIHMLLNRIEECKEKMYRDTRGLL